MEQIKIGLIQVDGNETELILRRDPAIQKTIPDYVYANKRYSILLEKTGMDIKKVAVNGESIEFTVEQRRIFFVHSKIFFDQVGYAQLMIMVGNEKFYSEYMPILIREGEFIQSVPYMIEYIENNLDKLSPAKEGEDADTQLTGIQRRIQLTEKILKNFEKRLSKEKNQTTSLRNVNLSEKTHPRFNTRSPFHSGYPYGLKRNVFSFSESTDMDTEVEFLNAFLLEIHRVQKRLQISSIMARPEKEIPEEYLFSPGFLYQSLKESLDPVLETWKGIERKTRQLIIKYQPENTPSSLKKGGLMAFLQSRISELPAETERLARSWLALVVPKYEYTLEQNFSKISEMYEKYLLIKLIDLLKENGYRLKSSAIHYYPGQQEGDLDFENVFEFENVQGNLTLFYQPFIFDQFLLNGKTGLYRNNSTLEWGAGQYYTPDFVLRFERDGNNYYVILDAKFSSLATIRKEKIQNLIFKYVNSISPVKSGDRILGLEILYGKFSGFPFIESFYNRQFREIFPFIEFFPLAQGVNDEYHEKFFREFLSKIERAIQTS